MPCCSVAVTPRCGVKGNSAAGQRMAADWRASAAGSGNIPLAEDAGERAPVRHGNVRDGSIPHREWSLRKRGANLLMQPDLD